MAPELTWWRNYDGGEFAFFNDGVREWDLRVEKTKSRFRWIASPDGDHPLRRGTATNADAAKERAEQAAGVTS